jgi:hypothetical protein
MANQITIDIGAAANDGTGDPLRTAFNYVNNNFSNVWLTGLPNSNVQFSDNRILTVNTNANLVLAPNGIAKVVSNVSIVPNMSNVHSIGGSDRRWNTIYAQYLDISNDIAFGDLTVDGNLTVTGNIIEIGNIVTDSKTIQLANTASTANAANGSGITVGANDNIATLLYNSTSNVWTTNIGLNATGNVTGNYILGNGALLTGLAATYGNSNVAAYLPTYTGNLSAGNAAITNLTSSNLVNGRTGTFTGDQFSDGAMYVGTPAGTVLGSDVVIQITANSGSYSQTNFQNINPGVTASSDYILTANNGNNTSRYLDLGITSSGWDGSETNVLANLVANNGYLYVQDGNLTVGTRNGNVSYGWNFDTTGNLTAPRNISAVGNVTGNYFIGNGSQLTGLAATYGNANVATFLAAFGSNTLSTTGNVTVGNILARSVANVGNLTLTAGANAWVFGTDGILTLAGGATLKEGVALGALALGYQAGQTSQGIRTVAIGQSAGQTSQGARAVAVGLNAGSDSQGGAAVAIGAFAGATSQGTNSIILNATGANLDQTVANTFTVAPVRNDVANTAQVMFYNTTSKEITYGNVISVAGNITGGNLRAQTNLYVEATNGNLVLGDASATASPGLSSTNSITVTANRAGTAKEWVFTTDGGFAGSGNISGGNISVTGNIATDWLNISNTGNTATLQADVSLQIVANASGSAPYWQFNSDGNLYVPGSINGDNNGPLLIDGNGSGTEGYISLPPSNFGGEQIAIVNKFSSGNGIRLQTNGGNLVFGDDGNLTLPGGGIIYDNSGFTTVTGNTGVELVATGVDSGAYVGVEDTISSYMLAGNATAASNIVVSLGNIVARSSGNISVTADTNTWTFDDTGYTQFPNSTITDPTTVNQINLNDSSGIKISTFDTNDIVIETDVDGGDGGIWTFYNDGRFGPGLEGQDNDSIYLTGRGATGSSYLRWNNNQANVALPSDTYITAGNGVANISILNDGVGGFTQSWVFDATGNLTVPGNIVMPPGASLVGNGASPAPSISGFSNGEFGGNVSVTGNITGGNLSVTGNITGDTAGFAIGYRDIPQVSFTGNATIATTDAGKHFYSTQSTSYTLTIANNASQGFQVGAAITVVNQGTGNITIAQGSGVTLYMAGNATSGNRSVATFGMATIMKVATNTWFVSGVGVA